MSWLAIVDWTQDGRVAKYRELDTEAGAQAHVAAFGGFVAEKPNAPWSHWLIDGNAQTVSVDPSLAPQPKTLREEIVDRLRSDAILRAQVIERRDALGLSNAQMLDLLEQKAAASI